MTRLEVHRMTVTWRVTTPASKLDYTGMGRGAGP
jgi:hypothetical protein